MNDFTDEAITFGTKVYNFVTAQSTTTLVAFGIGMFVGGFFF